MGKSFLILALLPAALCAKESAPKEPISVYYGSWKGEAKTAGASYNVSASFGQTGSTIKGSYTATNKKNMKKSYKGMFTMTKKNARCYTAKVKDTASPVVFEAEVCVTEQNFLRVTSFISNGTVTINKTNNRSNFNFRTGASKVTGSLSKIEPKKSGSAAGKKPEKSAEYSEDDDELPVPEMQKVGAGR